MSEEIIRPGFTRISAISNAYAGYSAVPPHVLENARLRGVAVHRLIDKWLDDVPGFVGELKPYLDSFQQFWEPYEDSEILLKEHRLYEDNLMITGKCDLLARMNGVVTLVDWKCTYKKAKHWQIQAAGYHLLATYCFVMPDRIEKIMFVRLRKDGKFPEVIEYEIEHDIFFKAYELYNLFMRDQENNLEDE